MNAIPKMLAITTMALGTALPLGSFAQVAMDHDKHRQAHAASVAPALADGEVRKVDLEAGKLTIKHGDIKHLDMPGMTMVFTAKDKSLLTGIKPGDKIKFMAVNEGGKMLVTDIQPVR